MIEPNSIDAIITDLPYGTTACLWDAVIPFDVLWKYVKRVLKPKGVFITTASQPFTSALIMSNPTWFRCEWIVSKKDRGTGWLNSKRYPMKSHENILVFAAGSHKYNPQMREGTPYVMINSDNVSDTIKDKNSGGYRTVNDGYRFPLSVIEVDWVTTRQHPTEKAVALYEYLVKTYTDEGDTVLDPTCGVGTTGVACKTLKRNYILGEKEEVYYIKAVNRLRMPFEQPIGSKEAKLSDLPLFSSEKD